MKVMVLYQPGTPLLLEERPDPALGEAEVRVRVEACAVCRTDLHVVDGVSFTGMVVEALGYFTPGSGGAHPGGDRHLSDSQCTARTQRRRSLRGLRPDARDGGATPTAHQTATAGPSVEPPRP